MTQEIPIKFPQNTPAQDTIPQLVYRDTGKPVQVGDWVTSRGVAYKILAFPPPHKPAASGFIIVQEEGSMYQDRFYVTVFGMKWINRTDR